MSAPAGLSEDDTRRGLRAVTWFGITTHAMATLVGGIFLTKVALSFGASLFAIGLLAALPSLAQLTKIPATYAIERYRVRKPVALLSFAGARLNVLVLAILPFAFSAESAALGLGLLLGTTFLRGAFAAAGGSAWESLLRDLVPQDRLGSFFSRRQKQNTLLAIPLSLGAAGFLAYWTGAFPSRELQAYSVLFLLGFLAGAASLYFLFRTPDPPLPPSQPTRLRALFAPPFADRNFRRLILFGAPWEFAMALAGPFFTVYILQRLGYGMSYVIGLTVLSQLSNAAFSQVWGALSDRFSNKAVLEVSGPLKLLAIGLWLLTALPERHRLTLPLLAVIHVLLGMAMSGVTLATANIGRKLAPRGRATSYLAAKSLVGSLSAAVAPIVGGSVANAFAGYRLSFAVDWTGPEQSMRLNALNLQGMDFAFVLAILIGLYSMHRLSFVVEEGEGDRSVVVHSLVAEMKRPVLTFTTVGGFNRLVEFPYGAMTLRHRRDDSASPDDARPPDDESRGQ